MDVFQNRPSSTLNGADINLIELCQLATFDEFLNFNVRTTPPLLPISGEIVANQAHGQSCKKNALILDIFTMKITITA